MFSSRYIAGHPFVRTITILKKPFLLFKQLKRPYLTIGVTLKHLIYEKENEKEEK